MEELLIAGGWLDDLLRERISPSAVKKDVRNEVQSLERSDGGGWAPAWEKLASMIRDDRVGEAYSTAAGTLAGVVDKLEKIAPRGRADLARPFSPFMIRAKEIKKVLNGEDAEELGQPADDLETVIGLERINAMRRLLASWGANIMGEGSVELIRSLEDDLEELGESQAFFMGDADQELAGSDREEELADRLATLATRFAQGLMELHLMNARSPEVRKRFEILWRSVRRSADEGNVRSAALEALQVYEEALAMAGLGSGDLVQRTDLLYEHFTDAERLRKAVKELVDLSLASNGGLTKKQGLSYIEAITGALEDLGLELE